MTRRIIPIAALLLLAACQDDVPAETEADAEREAEGEVLGGTISDDMLPLDDVRSQSPPLQENGEGGSGDSETTAPDAPAANPAEQNPAQQDPTMTPDPGEG